MTKLPINRKAAVTFIVIYTYIHIYIYIYIILIKILYLWYETQMHTQRGLNVYSMRPECIQYEA